MTARKKQKARSRRGAVSEKAPKTYRLSPARIAEAQRILGAPTATAAIEQALDMVVFRKEIVEGTAAMYGVRIASVED